MKISPRILMTLVLLGMLAGCADMQQSVGATSGTTMTGMQQSSETADRLLTELYRDNGD